MFWSAKNLSRRRRKTFGKEDAPTGSEIDAAGADSSFHCFGITEDKSFCSFLARNISSYELVSSYSLDKKLGVIGSELVKN